MPPDFFGMPNRFGPHRAPGLEVRGALGLVRRAALLARLPAPLAFGRERLGGIRALGLGLPQGRELLLDARALGDLVGRILGNVPAVRPEAVLLHALQHGVLVRLADDALEQGGLLVVCHGCVLQNCATSPPTASAVLGAPLHAWRGAPSPVGTSGGEVFFSEGPLGSGGPGAVYEQPLDVLVPL
jgi:hypothetical protein